jgi:hypothetical protein
MSYRDEFRHVEGEAYWTARRLVFPMICVIIFILFLSLVHWLVSVPAGVASRVINPNAIVQNYEWFEDQYQDIRAANAQIDIARKSIAAFEASAGPRVDWTFDMREELARLRSNLDALEFYRAKLIADYNAKSRMITRNLWKSDKLPYTIEAERHD